MNGDRGQVVVVQPGPSQLGFGQVEAERLDQMQFTAGCGGARCPFAGLSGDMLGDSGGDLGRGLSYSSDCQLFTSAPGRLGRTASRHEQEVYESLRFSSAA